MSSAKTLSSKPSDDWQLGDSPTKANDEVKLKYFETEGGHNWVLDGDFNGKESRLFCTAGVPTECHIKIIGPANLI